MRKQLLFSLVALTILTVSCKERSEKAYEESVEAQNEMSGELHEVDTNMVKRDGTILPGTLDQADTVQLPSPVLEAIARDNSLSIDKITRKRIIEEESITYYEVTFVGAGEQSRTIIYDENGKIKLTD